MLLKVFLSTFLLFAELASTFTPAFHRRHIFCQSTTYTPQNALRLSKESLSDEEMGLNELQTLLRDAVQRQDYVAAGEFSDQLFVRLYRDDMPKDEEEKRLKRRRMSWRGLGAAPWLVDRLDSLNYTFPTTIQINTMESVNRILQTKDEDIETRTLEERIETSNKDMGVVVSGSTGSGKTLAFLSKLNVESALFVF